MPAEKKAQHVSSFFVLGNKYLPSPLGVGLLFFPLDRNRDMQMKSLVHCIGQLRLPPRNSAGWGLTHRHYSSRFWPLGTEVRVQRGQVLERTAFLACRWLPSCVSSRGREIALCLFLFLKRH